MRIAQLQTSVTTDKKENIRNLSELMDGLGDDIDLVTAGEMFTCPYNTVNFPVYAEPEGGESWKALQALAAKHHVILSAGTIPEIDEAGRVYNTAYVFGPDGSQLAKFRKMHLFDVDIEGGQVFHESETLTAGNEVVTFDTEFGTMGICICFDSRFPELFRLMALKGAKVILVPAAFNMSTGPAHWAILHRSNALSAQCFVVATSGARDPDYSYVAWGHSLIASPWGDLVAEMDEKPGIQITDIDLSEVESVRKQLPVLSARRTDVYQLTECNQMDTTA